MNTNRYIKDGVIRKPSQICVVTTEDGSELYTYNPPEEMILADGWMPYDDRQERYEERVAELIREKYSVNQELAILRQRDGKPEEFELYNAYAENCKARAKEEVFGEPAS